MEAGKLRNRIIFRKKVESKDRMGGEVDDWTDDSNDIEVPAAFEVAGTSEFPSSWKRMSETTARFRVRFNPTLAEDPAATADQYRILLGTRAFNIFPPYDSDQKRRELIIEAQEIV